MSAVHYLQNWLRSGGSVKALSENYAITVKQHPRWPNLHQFTYSQLDSPKNDPLVRGSRGTILDASCDWSVVAHPFPRFLNVFEDGADPIEFATSIVQEKVDGSLMILYWYGDQWNVATKGSPDAGGCVGRNRYLTFGDLFHQTWEQQLVPTGHIPRGYTHLFELTTPYNEVVVPHAQSKLTYLTSFGNGNGVEDNLDYAFRGADKLKEFHFSSIEEMQEFANSLNGLESEGFVVKSRNPDGTWNRVKVKGASYLAYHHARSSFSPRNVLNAIRKGEASEVFAMVKGSDLKTAVVNEVNAKYENLVKVLTDAYEAHQHIPVQKDFALTIQGLRLPMQGAMYALRSGQAKSVRAYLENVNIKSLAETLQLKEEPDGTPEGE